MGNYIIALDQGTTSSRALLFNERCEVCGVAQQPFEQHFPHPGWVEHDPSDILATEQAVLVKLMHDKGLSRTNVAAIGITNQRETTIVWNRVTGEPVCNAIVWQCRRTASLVDHICSTDSIRRRITKTTGLIPDAYFSASKIRWILDNIDGAREAADAGDLLFGTVDSWLIWNLTAGAVHATDVTNASRTMLYDIHHGCWDPWLCDLFDIPRSMLPDVRPSSGSFGTVTSPSIAAGIPLCGVAGDQQAALFGQCCTKAGQAKNTYGTGCFMLMHTGAAAVESHNGLVTTIAASAPGTSHFEYALEGSIFMGGALIQWLRDEMGLLSSAAESERVALSVPDTAGVYVVPAFTGLGAPYWDPEARGAIYGLTRGTTRAHIVRASLEALAYQVADLMRGMQDDSGIALDGLSVDGGACSNDFLMQFQSDILAESLYRPSNTETTAAGAAYLAGLCCGFWNSADAIKDRRKMERRFDPHMSDKERIRHLDGWHECIERTRSHVVQK
ncbi:MAG: glycerol kinase GlpK [Eggerthellaceae bacterium]|jgi:glycerol kinase|nr:glycerol kinase GlpK [Eggerthellaceae bacterium]